MAYGQLLYDLARQAGCHVHLEVAGLIPGAGDPMARITRARKEIAKRVGRRTKFSAQFVLMEIDQVESHGLNLASIEKAAAEQDIKIVWQTPCHEGLLLRHLAPNQTAPVTSDATIRELKKRWPAYDKPLTRAQLAKLLDVDQVLAAAAQEPALTVLLTEIGLVRV